MASDVHYSGTLTCARPFGLLWNVPFVNGSSPSLLMIYHIVGNALSADEWYLAMKDENIST